MYDDWAKVFIRESINLSQVTVYEYRAKSGVGYANYMGSVDIGWSLFSNNNSADYNDYFLEICKQIAKTHPWMIDIYFHIVKGKKCYIGAYNGEHTRNKFYKCDLNNV